MISKFKDFNFPEKKQLSNFILENKVGEIVRCNQSYDKLEENETYTIISEQCSNKIKIESGIHEVNLLDSSGNKFTLFGSLRKMREMFSDIPREKQVIAEEKQLEPQKEVIKEFIFQMPEPGPVGMQGERGTPGLKGDKGDRGDGGAIGEKGDKGDKGDQGEKGDKGDVGEKGDKGDSGEKGDKGDKGDEGDKGDRGEIGPKGEKGDKGDDGKPGKDGNNGKDGADGKDGKRGEKGERGPTGKNGKIGPRGPKGKDGKNGKDSKDGKPGPQGPVGPKGEKGDKGEQGDTKIDKVEFPLELKDKTLKLSKKYQDSIDRTVPVGKGYGGEGGGGALRVYDNGVLISNQIETINFKDGFNIDLNTPKQMSITATATGGGGGIAGSSGDVGVMYLKNNATGTVVNVAGTRAVVEGGMTTGILYNFVKDTETNSLKYTGVGGRFHVLATFSFLSQAPNKTCGFYIGHNKDINSGLSANGDRISESEIYVNSGSASNPYVAGAIQTVLDLKTNDRVFFIVQNKNETNLTITVEFLKFTVTPLIGGPGNTGNTGNPGIQGNTGATGPTGPAGEIPTNYVQSIRGLTGIIDVVGTNGIKVTTSGKTLTLNLSGTLSQVNLEDINDTNINEPQTGQALFYDGTDWVNDFIAGGIGATGATGPTGATGDPGIQGPTGPSRSEFSIYDRFELYDFASPSIDLPFVSTSVGTWNTNQNTQANAPLRFGIVNVESGTTAATTRHAFQLSGNVLNFPTDNKYTNTYYGSLYTASRLVLPSATNPFVFFSGFIDSISGTATDGVYFIHDHTISENFLCETRRLGGGFTYIDSGVSWTNLIWYDFKIVVQGASSANFYINDSLVGTITEEIPRGSEAFFIAEGVRRTATGSTLSVGYYMDYIGLNRKYTP
jgi:hypothetical protein